jgi:hypothetical protein
MKRKTSKTTVVGESYNTFELMRVAILALLVAAAILSSVKLISVFLAVIV